MPQYVKQIDEYLIKDELARNTLDLHTTKINEVIVSVNEQKNSISEINSKILALENATNLSMNYDAETETITFSSN